MTIVAVVFVIGWFVCGIWALSIDTSLEDNGIPADTPEIVWLAMFGPILLIAVLVEAVSEAKSSRRHK